MVPCDLYRANRPYSGDIILDTALGNLKIVLRIEGLSIVLACLCAYSKFGAGWGVFALFFLAPDLSMLGYLAGSKVGALLYNIAHSYIGAALLLGIGIVLSSHLAITTGIIWIAHIGLDRALGYGLKYSTDFRSTHLGVIGRAANHSSTGRTNDVG